MSDRHPNEPQGPLSLVLARNDDPRMHRLTSAGLSKGIETILRVVFGPVSATVLMSLREIGIPAIREELGDLRRATEAETRLAPRPAAVRRAVLAWRLYGLVGRIGEQLAGLVDAVDAWQGSGEPVYADGRLGEVFLRSRSGNPRETLGRFRQSKDVRRLLGYPTPASLVRVLSNQEIRDLDRGLDRSASAAAQGFGRAAEAFTDESYRTFIRWKHAVSITSPLAVPIWIAETDDATKREALAALATGFGIVDLESSPTDQPHIIIWPDSDARVGEGLALAEDMIVLTMLVLESVLCWGNPEVPPIPVHPSVANAAHARISKKLASNEYRRRLVMKSFPLSTFPNEYG